MHHSTLLYINVNCPLSAQLILNYQALLHLLLILCQQHHIIHIMQCYDHPPPNLTPNPAPFSFSTNELMYKENDNVDMMHHCLNPLRT